MTAWKRICCAVDFEEPSRLALEQAADLARALGADLTVLHVVTPPPDVVGAPLGPFEGAGAVRAKEGEVALERWRAWAEGRAGRPVAARLREGHPSGEILRHARETGCDLLVIGTHGRTGVPRLVLGSVAERVARQAGCPVLVVHGRALRGAHEEAEEAALYR